ncbi:P-II family nitrogen regulator [Polynucleobacter sp. 15G-AUS-farblos]|uniref:P-II family nitrogen regulator n=1 Tax=Polynucleobacter sp. 15G-AUS-farblos TaxID=2689094 RepID=UPI001C0DB1B6|nr:P-II family nitrogen regulator [Polynucleobacter sp. 15G-AUS-farblos]MBU3584250.1 P-II family nitrogen regulator [Polynucleobacter sp. 15G-AUS-farblos]
MMEVKAVIRPNKLATLRTALLEMPEFPGMTVFKVEGCSAPSKTNKSTIKDELTDYSAKIRIEIVCSADVADVLMDKIVKVCQTGQVGDGVVWCTPVPKGYFIAKSTGSI